MKKVVVSQRVDVWADRKERRDTVDQALTAFIARAGGLPIVAPNLIEDLGLSADWLSALEPDAIVLSGGNDIGEAVERDRLEAALLDYAADRAIPLLGICRGMQMMAHWGGAELKTVAHHVGTRHTLSGAIAGTVNSYHRLGLAALPAAFAPLAWSEDGEIEAMKHRHLPWEAWMWHPERETEFADRDIERLRELTHARTA